MFAGLVSSFGPQSTQVKHLAVIPMYWAMFWDSPDFDEFLHGTCLVIPHIPQFQPKNSGWKCAKCAMFCSLPYPLSPWLCWQTFQSRPAPPDNAMTGKLLIFRKRGLFFRKRGLCTYMVSNDTDSNCILSYCRLHDPLQLVHSYHRSYNKIEHFDGILIGNPHVL